MHALVGANGAGKSTCLGVLAGRVPPSEGIVEIFGKNLAHGSPRESRRAGVAAVYQELMMVPTLSTQANVFLGQELGRRGVRAERAMRSQFLELTRKLGVSIPADVRVSDLSVADQQLVEIMRGLVSNPRVLLFDEPTASLAPHERRALFDVIRGLRSHGVTMLIVSHNLDEVLDISDAVTVFRNGRVVQSGPVEQWTKPTLVKAMLGHDRTGTVSAGSERRPEQSCPPILEVEDLEVPRILGPVSFQIVPGEILGIGGVVGSGRSTLLKSLLGLEPRARGRMRVKGLAVPWPRTVPAARRSGIALVPEDRKESGLFHALTAAENVVISDLSRVARGGLVSKRGVRRAAATVSRSFGIADARLTSTATHLSGGNQQKLLLARWAHCRPDVLLADEPTRGVDVGAKDQIMSHSIRWRPREWPW